MKFKDKFYQEGIIGDFIDKNKDNFDDDERTLFSTDKSTRIRDRVNAAGNIAGDIDKSISSHRTSNASIIARARNSVMQFPIYTVPTIRVNEIHIIGKLFERVYADFVRTVISQHPIIDEDEANNLQFLKQFHTNLAESAEVLVNKYYHAIDDIDSMIKESVFHTERLSDNCIVEFAVVPSNNDLINMESTRLAEDPLAGFGYYFKEDDDGRSKSTKSILDNRELRDSDIIKMMDADHTNILDKNEMKKLKYASDDEKRRAADKKWKEQHLDTANDTTKLDYFKNLIDSGIAQSKFSRKGDPQGGFTYMVMDNLKSTETTARDEIKAAVDAPVFLKDADVKKNNGMAPFNIECTFRIRNRNGIETKEVKYIIGIKTILHIVSTQDLADELRDLITGNVKTLQKVRYKTGEISFLNYLFNIKGLKADALKRTNSNKRWISTLKRLSDYRNMNGSLLKGTNAIASELMNGSIPIPNGTLILTQADVLYLTSSTGIDLSVVGNAKKLMSNLFLIAVAIVDSSAGTMKVLFDKDVSWDVQSLAAIDAEVSKMDNSNLMKELNKMVNK